MKSFAITDLLILATFILYRETEKIIKSKKRKTEHIVLFKFKKSITRQEKKKIINRFMAMNKSLKDGKRYMKIEYGYQNSQENLNRGFEIGFRISFSSQEDRNYYIGKPFLTIPGTYDLMHDEFKNFITPYLSAENGVLVFDYEPISN